MKVFLHLDPDDAPVMTHELPIESPALATNRITTPTYELLHKWVRFAPRRYVLADVEIKLFEPEQQALVNALKGRKQ